MSASERWRRLSREGAWIVMGQACAVIGAFIGVRLLTSLLTPAEYGQLALGMTVATLVNQLVMGPLCNGATRMYAPAAEAADLGGFGADLGRLLVRAAVAMLAIIPLLAIVLQLTGRTSWLAITAAAVLFAVLTGANAVLNGVLNAARERSVAATYQGAESLGRSLVAAAGVYLVARTSTVAMAGYALVSLLVLFAQARAVRRKLPPSDPATRAGGAMWDRQMLRFAAPFASFGVFTWAQLASDRWSLQIFGSTQQVGRYAVLYQLGYYPVTLASNMAMQLLAPVYYQRIGDASDEQRTAAVRRLGRRLTNGVLALTVAAFLGTLALHGLIFRIAASADYASVSYLLPWLILSGGLFAAGQSLSLNLMSEMRSETLVAAKVSTALLAIALNFLGAWRFGTPGVVGANVIFATAFLVWMELLLRRSYRGQSA